MTPPRPRAGRVAFGALAVTRHREVFALTFGLLMALTLVVCLRSYRVRSHSMAAGLMPGDLLLGEVLTPDLGWFYRDQVYSFRVGNKWVLKRLVGLPGDALALRGPRLLRAGHPQPEAQARYEQGGVRDLPALVVPPRRGVLLGDNRDQSEDSRQFGTVELAHHGGRLLWRIAPLSRFGPVR